VKSLKSVVKEKAAAIDEKEAAAKAEEAAAVQAEAEAEAAKSDPGWVTFLGSFGIIVREGLEAILVIAAIIAYLTKSGNAKSLRNIYIGAIAGILASFAAAVILYFVKQAVAGAGQGQEIIEGVTALIAVCVLFYVSNWMISKSEAAAWTNYIDGKVKSSLEQGSSFALAFTAFLSVFREGAEVVLFYQPMLSGDHPGMVWAGFGVGCVVLVFVYLAITKLSIKLPIKVFFTATSILMAVMCVSFLGSGIKELAEGGVFDMTLRVPGIPENDVVQLFGIYPYLETLVPQLILSIILLITFMIAHYRGKIAAVRAECMAQKT
jgi:high-affinity iron transporter